MKPDNINAMLPYPSVKKELSAIPEDLWDIFWCKTPQEWWKWELNLQQRRRSSPNRREVFHLVSAYRLPIYMRRWSLREVETHIRIQIAKYKMKQWREDGKE